MMQLFSFQIRDDTAIYTELCYTAPNEFASQATDSVLPANVRFTLKVRTINLLDAVGWQKGRLACKNQCQLSQKVLF